MERNPWSKYKSKSNHNAIHNPRYIPKPNPHAKPNSSRYQNHKKNAKHHKEQLFVSFTHLLPRTSFIMFILVQADGEGFGIFLRHPTNAQDCGYDYG